MSNDPLVERAREAALKAYAPYSKFSVGAAVESVDGEIVLRYADKEPLPGGTKFSIDLGLHAAKGEVSQDSPHEWPDFLVTAD